MTEKQTTNHRTHESKPPLGLRPRSFHLEEVHASRVARQHEILDAMMRYHIAKKPIPLEWAHELYLVTKKVT